MNAIALLDIETNASQPLLLGDFAELGQLALSLARAVARKAEHQLEAAVPDTGKAPNYLQIFLRLGNLLRQIRALHISATTGQAPRSRAKRATQPANPRRDLLRQAIDYAEGEGEARAARRRTAYDTLDLHLAADTNSEKRAAAILHAVLDPMGIPISFSKMPSALRDALTGKRA